MLECRRKKRRSPPSRTTSDEEEEDPTWIQPIKKANLHDSAVLAEQSA